MSSLKLKFLIVQSCCIHKKLHKIFKFQGQFDLEGQGHQFSNTSEILRSSMNSLSVKAKYQIGQFKSLKQIFYKFEGQFDLECSRSRVLK